MVANRLPVDLESSEDGTSRWVQAPGGLVAAVEPIVKELGCTWVGWAGSADEQLAPFSVADMSLVPVPLSSQEIENYYEGFANGTLWPLYHDVISAPGFHRHWWESYQAVNRRFAEYTANVAARGAIVWVHDYQLQLVPQLLRTLRPDLTIAFFLHIPFPPTGIFAQLPWREQIIEGLLGSDVIGFQRVVDATQFRAAAETYVGTPVLGNLIAFADENGEHDRTVLCQEFPISIDVSSFQELVQLPNVKRRAGAIREELGNPATLMLGVDRLDYTKGILHRLKAYGELLNEGQLDPERTTLIQIASPSRERVEAYMQLRDETEIAVGRINGEHSSIAQTPLIYQHRAYDKEEMASLYLAADVLLVTPLRDGMNLVAKEYVACRGEHGGVLVLSEFAGAADELELALSVNPHDIDGLKERILDAINMGTAEQKRRMSSLYRVVCENDVAHWAENFLGAVLTAAKERTSTLSAVQTAPITLESAYVPRSLEDRLRRLAVEPNLIVASDFDGTLAPIVSKPEQARALDRSRRALEALSNDADVAIVILTGRSLESLRETGLEHPRWVFSGSHGLELNRVGQELLAGQREQSGLTPEETAHLTSLRIKLQSLVDSSAAWIEDKPFGLAVHTRDVRDPQQSEEILQQTHHLCIGAGLNPLRGKRVMECMVRRSDKGRLLEQVRESLPKSSVLYLGDDVTDEHVFARLGSEDLGVKVGTGDSRAQERVPNAQTVAAVLAHLAELRTGIVIGH